MGKETIVSSWRIVCTRYDNTGITWHHVPTDQNPADLGSRRGSMIKAALWKSGPQWLNDPEQWPPKTQPGPSAESNAESKVTREVFATAIPVKDEFSELLEKHSLWKTLRVGAWVRWFLFN